MPSTGVRQKRRARTLICAVRDAGMCFKCAGETLLQAGAATLFNDDTDVTLHAPPLPIPYGTHHSKVLIEHPPLVINPKSFVLEYACYRKQKTYDGL